MEIDLDTTLLGGQAFNWDRINDRYYGFTMNGIVRIEQRDGAIFTNQINESLDINSYLNVSINDEVVRNEIDKDENIHKALSSIQNITVLKQDFIQTTLSYILATNKNIPAIRKSIREISRRYGEKYLMDDLEMYTFPSPSTLASASINDLLETKIGYRAQYLKESAKLITENSIYSTIQQLSKEDARKILLKLPGIGPKVADCILLYSLGFLDTVPIDIWMYNVAKDIYKMPYTKYQDISNWYTTYFGRYAGIAGQYLFEYYRKNS